MYIISERAVKALHEHRMAGAIDAQERARRRRLRRDRTHFSVAPVQSISQPRPAPKKEAA